MLNHPKPIVLAVRALSLACFPAFFVPLCGQIAHAQDAANPELKPKHAPLESRLISDSELENFIGQLAMILSMATQDRDPFGALQDPDAVAKVLPTEIVGLPAMAEFTTSFEDIVMKINVTTVMPADRRFLIGTRSFGINDVVIINFRGRPIRARVEEVTARQIRFRNEETNAVATRTLGMLPAGMSASGGTRQKIPGLIPTGPNVPIDLE